MQWAIKILISGTKFGALMPEGQMLMTKLRCLLSAKLIPGPLHNKLLGLSPPPATLNALVEKARDFDTSWCMFTRPKPNCRPQNPHVQEIKGEDATNSNPDIN